MKLDCGFVIYVIKQLIIKIKHNISKSHKHKENFSDIVREYEITTPDTKRIDSIFNNCAKECYNKNFHTFQLWCIFDIEMRNGDFVNGIKLKQKFERKVLYIN